MPYVIESDQCSVLVKDDELWIQTLFPDALCISAKTGLGLELLSTAVSAKCKGPEVLLRISSSPSNGKVQGFLRRYGTIINEQYSNGRVLIDARLAQNRLAGLKRSGPESIEIID